MRHHRVEKQYRSVRERFLAAKRRWSKCAFQWDCSYRTIAADGYGVIDGFHLDRERNYWLGAAHEGLENDDSPIRREGDDDLPVGTTDTDEGVEREGAGGVCQGGGGCGGGSSDGGGEGSGEGAAQDEGADEDAVDISDAAELQQVADASWAEVLATGAAEGEPTGDDYEQAMEEMQEETDPWEPEAEVRQGDAIEADGELLVEGDERNVPIV